jgi:hypothetical protein
VDRSVWLHPGLITLVKPLILEEIREELALQSPSAGSGCWMKATKAMKIPHEPTY